MDTVSQSKEPLVVATLVVSDPMYVSVWWFGDFDAKR
jgi:hypothetical protein